MYEEFLLSAQCCVLVLHAKVSSPGVPVSIEVNLEQPEERMLRQKQPHTQGQKLPTLKNDIQTHLSPETENLSGKLQKR